MRLRWILAALLAVVTLFAYAEVRRFDFVTFDDGVYVYENPQVRSGLSAQGIGWAFATNHGANWHPVTWLSHMTDVQLFGVHPGPHHVVNLLFHIANAILLFLILQRMTHRTWPGALVAALFAIHPLHVESVAWISERKDVLSTFFGLLAIGSYVEYARRGGARLYGATIAFLAVGLLCKSMLVTLPFVFLLLDYWPLERLSRKSARRLVIEKLPFLAAVAVISIATLLVQRGAGAAAKPDWLEFRLQIANAVAGYAWYAIKMIWPGNLAVLHPHPWAPGGTPLTAGQIIGSSVLLLAITAAALKARGQRYLLTGWLWYLGMLVPVIGLVRIGYHGVAERYSYVPLVGLFVMIAWGGAELLARMPRLKWVAFAVAAVVTVSMTIATRAQVATWENSETLYRHAIAVHPRNPIMHYNLGEVLQTQGKTEEAMSHYVRALEIDPKHYEARNNLGNALCQLGRLEEGMARYRESLAIRPDFAKAHNNLGSALQTLGQIDAAAREYAEALRLDPGYAKAHFNLALVFEGRGDMDGAIRHYREATRLDPGYAKAQEALGWILISSGQLSEAIEPFQRAVESGPSLPGPHHGLAMLLAGNPDEAKRDLGRAVEHAEIAATLTERRDVTVLETLSDVYDAVGRRAEAVSVLQLAIPLADQANATDLAQQLRAKLIERSGQ